MRNGDLVLLRDVKGRRFLFRLKEGASFSHHRGTVSHEALIEAGVGGRVKTHQGEPLFVHQPTLEDYLLLMPREATPTYPKDAAAIVMLLDLAPGEEVLEAGSGSGGLSLFLARAVGPVGRVDSYELRQDFLKKTRHNIQAWGADNIHLHQQDLSDAVLNCLYDAVALDMMEPWTVLKTVTPALKPDRALVAYLPNITQVVTLVQQVNELRYPYVLERVIEVAHREWTVRPPVAHPSFKQIGHTAFLAKFKRLQDRREG